MGLNIGEVIEDRGDIYGDGVNVAARLEALADPGGICISESARIAVGKRLPLCYEFLGEQTVKNIAQPVRAYSVQAEGYRAEALPVSTSGDRPTIAVLPFDNMSGAEEDEYFADGMTEDLITALSKNRWLSVIARNSTFVYKGQSVDVRHVACDLRAGFVVEGSVRRAGNRVRISAQLLEAASGEHLWAERYDRELDDIFAVQDRISAEIVAALRENLKLDLSDPAPAVGTPNMAAHDAVLRGVKTLHTVDHDRIASRTGDARAHLDQAVSQVNDFRLSRGIA